VSSSVSSSVPPPTPSPSLDDLVVEVSDDDIRGSLPNPASAPPPVPSSISASDPFAVVRRAGVNPVAAWFRDGRPEASLSETTVTPLSDDEAVAAACFERGLALVSEHRLRDAVIYWERAAALAPARRSYQANLRRLIAQLQLGKDGGGPPTPTPLRNPARDVK
jgi:hypothetical protein